MRVEGDDFFLVGGEFFCVALLGLRSEVAGCIRDMELREEENVL